MRFLAVCLAASALALVSVSLLAASQAAPSPTIDDEQQTDVPNNRLTASVKLTPRLLYPLEFSLN